MRFLFIVALLSAGELQAHESPMWFQGGFILCEDKRGAGSNEGYSISMRLPRWEAGVGQCDGRSFPVTRMNCISGERSCAFIPAYNFAYFLYKPKPFSFQAGRWSFQFLSVGLVIPSKSFILNCHVCFKVEAFEISKTFKPWPNFALVLDATHMSNGEILDKKKEGSLIPTERFNFPEGIGTTFVKNPDEDYIGLGFRMRF